MKYIKTFESFEQKENISTWLEKSRKVDNKELFQDFLNII